MKRFFVSSQMILVKTFWDNSGSSSMAEMQLKQSFVFRYTLSRCGSAQPTHMSTAIRKCANRFIQGKADRRRRTCPPPAIRSQFDGIKKFKFRLAGLWVGPILPLAIGDLKENLPF